ncbi:MAG: hypothetical protein BMS9Abin29_2235 [Gemmatimonadota bacterium]|nr:MAG: hypothetical protein BMS9Abin29_2235 [Gemmatimonadota bacterium]
MPSSRLITLATVVVSTALIASCGGDGGTSIDTITSVSVNPGNVTLQSLGATAQFSATAGGSQAAGATFSWSSSDLSVASVGATGLVTAVSNGTATITATAQGTTVSGTATVTVAQVATSIDLTPASDTLTSGETLQIEATIQDANGAGVPASLTWMSSNPAVASVDATGLVTAVTVGEATITASQDGATGTVTAVVIRADFMPTADVTLGGTVEVAEMMVPAGVIVTLSADAAIDAEGPVMIAGDVIGDCLGLSLTGQDAITISGTFSNACLDAGEDPPALTISGPALMNLDGATITSSGGMRISNAAPPAAAPARRSARLSRAEPQLTLEGTHLSVDPPTAPPGTETTTKGRDGKGIDIEVGGKISLNGTSMFAQAGGRGFNKTVANNAATDTRVTAGHGGDGGAVSISAPAGVSPEVIFSEAKGANRLVGGDGGPGGNSTLGSVQNPLGAIAPGGTAEGGNGGAGGNVFINLSTLAPMDGEAGPGGKGGNATSTGADGVPADAARVAQIGGDGRAIAGDGGRAGQNLLSAGSPDVPVEGGSGGEAIAVAGTGGAGSLENRDGAAGGWALAAGGDGGIGWIMVGGPGGAGSVSGGNGGEGQSVCITTEPIGFIGSIYVVTDPAGSDEFLFGAGPQPGVSLAISSEFVNEGGRGGDGGVLEGFGGLGGGFGTREGPAGATLIGPGANGGKGGAGEIPGMGGDAGMDKSGSTATVSPPVFRIGDGGGPCPGGTSPAPTSRRASLPAPTRTVRLTGAAPWVTVTGTTLEDGTFTATGRGVVNFNPNILVEFAGTFDEQAGTIVGTYTIDSERIITALHPIVYQVDVAVPPAARANRTGG